MSLIEEYLEKTLWIANETKETYGDKKSVAKHNRYATRMRSIALQIHEKSPELKFEFSKLLTHDNDDVRIWVAHHIAFYILQLYNRNKKGGKNYEKNTY